MKKKMEEKIQLYFSGEKAESLVFLTLGLIAILTALFFLFYLKRETLAGMAYPLLMVGLIQVVVGGTVYFRTDNQTTALINQVETNPEQYLSEELPRMKTVNKWFNIYKVIEVTLILGGIALLFYGFHYHKNFWLGVGIGLVLQSTLMLVADFFAENRADVYTEHILNFQKDLSFLK